MRENKKISIGIGMLIGDLIVIVLFLFLSIKFDSGN